ncbi:hypothetical protein [Undibacterium curvum]|uniref:Uncharacterized protein n=1 Tax=Undibacterium curvum TaxID=2762294 RepID=A0ABR7A0F8_9BURK|nr:hypothetical protein [Undibacterium curvum]MBC3930398.1 hypothetical protein [Undibacterium curvum]
MERVKGLSTAPTEVDELQEIARIATRVALEEYERIPVEWDKNLTLGTYFDGDDKIFELYIAAERPSEAVVISSARVNRKIKTASVAISNLAKKATP